MWTIIILLPLFELICGAPVPGNPKPEDSEPIQFFDELNKHDYSDYMNDVLKELENDKNFIAEIHKNAGSSSIEEYAQYLNAASENARTKLDEIKRREIKRLNMLEKKLEEVQTQNNMSVSETDGPGIQGNHLASTTDSKFKVEDLKALMTRATHDIKMVDRAEERKYRRMQIKKRLKQRKQLQETKDPEERRKLRIKFSENRKRPLSRPRIHEPGSEQQFTEVWETQDHLDPKNFDSKTFFKLHDLNQDDHWDIAEVEALVQADVNKLSTSEDKSVNEEERFHETMKMRQHMMEKMDSNGDQLISLDEFLHFEKSSEFKNDPEWKASEEDLMSLETEQGWESYQNELTKMLEENVESIAQLGMNHDESVATKL